MLGYIGWYLTGTRRPLSAGVLRGRTSPEDILGRFHRNSAPGSLLCGILYLVLGSEKVFVYLKEGFKSNETNNGIQSKKNLISKEKKCLRLHYSFKLVSIGYQQLLISI